MSGHLLESKMNLDEYQMHRTKGQPKEEGKKQQRNECWMCPATKNEVISDYTLCALPRVNEWRRSSIPKLNNE